MFVKLTSGFLLPAQLIRNLVLQDFSVTGSKSCKPEVTFAIHPYHPPLSVGTFSICYLHEESKTLHEYLTINLSKEVAV